MQEFGNFFSKIFAAPNFFYHSENFVKFFSDLPEFLKKISGNFLRPSNFGMKKSRLFHQTCLKDSAFHSRFFEKFSGF